jgi:hypothetical protein
VKYDVSEACKIAKTRLENKRPFLEYTFSFLMNSRGISSVNWLKRAEAPYSMFGTHLLLMSPEVCDNPDQAANYYIPNPKVWSFVSD